MTTREAVIKAVAVLSTAFKRESSATLTEAYQIGLDGLTADEVSAATKRALVECKFFPVPAELRALARPPRNIALETARAWEAVRSAMDRFDHLRTVDFGPLVNAVVRNLGGWQAACEWTISELNTWKRKEFERVYELLAAADPATLHGSPLLGSVPGPVVAIAIEGQPTPARALPAADTDSRAAARALIADLADSKAAPALDLRIPPRPKLEGFQRRRDPGAEAAARRAIAELEARVAAQRAAEAASPPPAPPEAATP